ncbi:MAG: hypothetical protein K6T73_07875 [Candidatus Bathyarchaeota archaeon]|nr:hypothetical protein [Candidatus Bathyarchaeota archaeon]
MIICQLFKYLYFIDYTLKEYYSQVKGQTDNIYDLIGLSYDFRQRCPLCGGCGCAEFIGYYHRGVIDEKGTYYKAFPIARFLCRRKGNPIVKHRTFSLLPYQLVPYTKYSIPFIIKTLKLVYVEDNSVKELQDYLAGFHEHQYIDFSRSSFYGFKAFILKCIDKMLASGYHQEAEGKLQKPHPNKRIRAFIEYAEGFTSDKTNPSIRGPCALGYDFYIRGGGYLSNSYFLFGTPSQFRI